MASKSEYSVAIAIATAVGATVAFLYGTFATGAYVDTLHGQGLDRLALIEKKIDKMDQKLWDMHNDIKKNSTP